MRNIFAVIVCLSLMLFGACSPQETAYSDFDRSADFTVYKTFAWLPSDSTKKTDPLYNNPILEKNIRNEVEQELRRKGYTLNETNPDVLVKLNLIVENKQGEISNPVYSTPNPNNQLNVIQPYNPFISNIGSYNNPNRDVYYNLESSPYNTNYYANNYPYNNGYGFPGGYISGYPNGYGIPAGAQGPYVIGTTRQTYQYKEGTIVVDILERNNRNLLWRGWGSSDITNPAAFENHLNDEVKAIFREYPVK
ncbi:MAG: DUF4136 domain-containing protein [Cytophagaceae bacterium]